jgi:SAM-dependent methyltransferase
MSTPDDTFGFNAEQYHRMYPPGVEASYWHVTRRLVVRRKLAKYAAPGAVVLDIGCGNGAVPEFLRDSGFDGYGADIAAPPVPSWRRPYVFPASDAFALPEGFRARVGVVLMLDVLEHLREPREMLVSAARSFPELSLAVITLPARAELWSPFDESFGHFRRYTRASTSSLLESAGFHVEECGYFFHAQYLPLRATVLLGARSLRAVPPRSTVAHRVLGHLLDWEERVLPPRWYGTSTVAVARPRR